MWDLIVSVPDHCLSFYFDNVSNEMLKYSTTTLLPCLHKLFNLVFSSRVYPSSWATGYITSIFKTGDCRQPGNYRGIAIISNVGKLFNILRGK